MIIAGMYYFGRKIIGVRKDFCANCKRECISQQWQSFYCYHLFFIPLIPLGWHRDWVCTLCMQDPRRKPMLKPLLTILGILVALICGALAFSAWMSPTEEFGGAKVSWTLRVLPLAVSVFLIWLIFLRPRAPEPSIEQGRAMLTPLNDQECFFCHGPLEPYPKLHCPSCKVTVYRD